jgi:hypothetical protein
MFEFSFDYSYWFRDILASYHTEATAVTGIGEGHAFNRPDDGTGSWFNTLAEIRNLPEAVSP